MKLYSFLSPMLLSLILLLAKKDHLLPDMAAADNQHHLAFIFGVIGDVISFMVYLAPVPTFYRIYKKKTTEGFQSLPYLVALFGSTLWLYYGIVKQNMVLLITINTFGSVMETLYIAMYIVYATNASRAQVIHTGSVEFMPFTLSFFLTLSGVLWFSYGMLLKDIFIANNKIALCLFIYLPNGLGFVLGLLQMLFYAIYRNRKQVTVDQRNKLPAPEHVTDTVILSIATSEVQSVDAKQCYDYDGKDGSKESDGDEHEKCVVEMVDVDASGDLASLQLKSDEPCAV
ncbi:hypothetical protein ACLB2K_034575 [Fragaria x ananassa]